MAKLRPGKAYNAPEPMRAVTVDYSHRDLRERDISLPALEREGDVLFRVLETGICGTDRELAGFQFGYGPQGSDFLVLGHEALGEVVQSSSDALRPGDLVVPAVRRACIPPCRMCSLGRRDLCVTGRYTERGIVGAHGYFTEFAVDDARDLVRVDRSLRELAVLIEPLSVVEKAVALALTLHQGEPKRALVLGAGTIGLLAGAVLQLKGLSVDLVSAEPLGSPRARLAEGIGLRYLAAPEGIEPDIVIEATGAPAAADAAFRALAPLGGSHHPWSKGYGSDGPAARSYSGKPYRRRKCERQSGRVCTRRGGSGSSASAADEESHRKDNFRRLPRNDHRPAPERAKGRSCDRCLN